MIHEGAVGQVWREKFSGRCFLMLGLSTLWKGDPSNVYDAVTLDDGRPTTFGLCYWDTDFLRDYERVA